MHEIALLKDLVIVLGAAVIVVAILRRFGIPSVAGFILTGVLAGPTALGLVDDPRQVKVLAEIGVVLLLFGIGLELSLDRLRRLWKAILLGGGFQVVVTIACAAVVANQFGMSPGAAIFIGCVVAVSSTAIVLKALSRRGEIDAPHGRLVLGILVFQDLCVVPMILAVPFLAGQGGSTQEVLLTIGTALAILAGVLLAARAVVPRLLAFVARTRERDLFILTVFLVCFGTAWAVSLAGISLALGAFLAGLVVAGSEFRHQALTDLIPARDVLASLFFVSVGMLLDVSDLLQNIPSTVGLLIAILAGKFVIILCAALILRLPFRVCILSAAALCQVGEFSFMLLGAASGTELLSATLSHNLLVAIILSMMLTPLAISFGPHLASGAARIPWLNRLLGVQSPGIVTGEPLRDHVVIAGYALSGQAICQVLRSRGIAYIVVDTNPENVREAIAEGDRVVLGDVTRREVLEELGCKNARLVVLAINDANATELATRTIRELAPDVAIVVRTPYEMDREALRAVGATQIITAEAAASKALVTASLTALDERVDGIEED